MILHALELENWRCFVDRIEVGPLGDRINVVHGPNGTGKSTLMWAMIRGLLDNHAVGGQAVEALRPWGRALSPRVTVEFEHDGHRFRLAKQFLGSASAELRRREGGEFVRVAEGDAADGRVREMLGGVAPGRGFTDERHWGLAQVLWAPQEKLELPKLATSVDAAIRASLGAQMSDASQDALEKTIDEAYLAIYTRGGRLKSGKDAPAVVAMEAELAGAEEERLALLERVAAFETAGRQIEDLRSRRDQAARDEAQLTKDLAAARAKAKAYDELRAEHDKQKEVARAAGARYSQTKRLVEEIRSLREELRQAEKESRRLGTEEPLRQKEVDQHAQDAERARAALEAVRQRRQEVDAAERTAQRAARFVENRRKLADAERLIDQVTAAQEELEQQARRRGELIAPDTRRLREIQTQIGRRDETRKLLAASGTTVGIVPEREIEVEVLSGESPGRRTITPETPCNLRGAPAVEFRVPGVGVFRATGPSDASVDELRDELAEAERRLDELLEGFGTRDLAELHRLHDQAEAMDKQIAAVRVRHDTLLGDRRLEDLEQQRASAARTMEETLAEHAGWAESPPDVDALDAEANQIHQRFVADVEAAEARWDSANNARSLAERNQALHQAQVAAIAARVRDLVQRIEQQTADGRDDAQRDEELTQQSMQFTAASRHVEVAEERLKSFVDDPHGDVDVLDRQLTSVHGASRAAVEELSRVEGRLQEIAADAPYSRLAEVEETIGRLRDSIAAERLRNDAIRLLHDVVSECRATAVDAVLGPVEARATHTLRRIAGSRLGGVRFGESFLPEGVAPELVDATVAIEELSGGEREQVHLAVRLALADVLRENQRQLVVLDDVLTATDTSRLARVLRILDEAAEWFQILILTCHPERYRGLPEATFFDLEKQRRG